MKSKLSVLSLGLCAALSAGTVRAASLKIGIVDLQKSLLETKRGKAANSSLEKEYEEKKKKIDAEQESIKKEEKSPTVLSEHSITSSGSDSASIALSTSTSQLRQVPSETKISDASCPDLRGWFGPGHGLCPDAKLGKVMSYAIVFKEGKIDIYNIQNRKTTNGSKTIDREIRTMLVDMANDDPATIKEVVWTPSSTPEDPKDYVNMKLFLTRFFLQLP